MRLDDAELVGRTFAGDWAAYSDLVGRYRDAVFGVAYHHLGDFDEAEDAAQEVFVRAYVRLKQLRDAARFAPWLHRIASSICVDILRRRTHDVMALNAEEPEAASADRDLEQTAARVTVKQALAKLSERFRLTVTLYYINGYSHGEIASFLQVPVNTVRTRLQRAKKQLRQEMLTMVDNVLKKERPGEGFAQEVEKRVFTYEATDSRGFVITGISEADSADTLVQRLRDKGYYVQKVESGTGTPPGEPDVEPIKRVAHVTLDQGLRDRADAIRVLRHESQVLVRYLIDGEWHEVMSIPAYVWPPFRAYLADLAGVKLRYGMAREPGRIHRQLEGRQHEFSAAFGRRMITLERRHGP